MRDTSTIEHHRPKFDKMYEDSQRFSDGDEADDNNAAAINPRRSDTQMSGPSLAAAVDVKTPETRGQIPPDISYYGESKSRSEIGQTQSGRALSNERDESMDRIVGRMSPSTRDRYIRYND